MSSFGQECVGRGGTDFAETSMWTFTETKFAETIFAETKSSLLKLSLLKLA